MIIRYIGDNGATVECTNVAPPVPPILLTEADGLYGYENTVYTSDQGGQDGSVFIGNRISARRIGLTLKLYGRVVETRNAILRSLSPRSLGTLRVIRGDLVRDIRCVTEKVTTNTQDGSLMNLYFLCPNPYWREENESVVNIATWEPLLSYPLTIEQGVGFMFGQRTEERVINVRNAGSAVAGMRVVFSANGTVTNPKIINAMDSSQYMLANVTLYAGDLLTISTGVGEKKATLYRTNGGVESNAFSLLDIAHITFLQLSPGDNYLSYSAAGGEALLTVAVFYYSSYLEV